MKIKDSRASQPINLYITTSNSRTRFKDNLRDWIWVLDEDLGIGNFRESEEFGENPDLTLISLVVAVG